MNAIDLLLLLAFSFGIAGIAYAFIRLVRPALVIFCVLFVLRLLSHHVCVYIF